MTGNINQNQKWHTSLLILFVLGILYIIGHYNFLLFHSFSEVLSGLIILCIFATMWHSLKFTDNHYYLFLSIACLFIGFMDILHVFSYKGMGIFPDADQDIPTKFWIASRGLQAVCFAIAPFFINRKINVSYTFTIFFLIFSVLVFCIFNNIFPVCYVEGEGITYFKIISEYIICFLLIAGVLHLLSYRTAFRQDNLKLVVLSIFLMIASEMTFTNYIHAYDTFNFIGHFAKITGFLFFYKAVLQEFVSQPYHLLSKNLEDRDDKYELLFSRSPVGIMHMDRNGVVTECNDALLHILKSDREKMVGFNLFTSLEDDNAIKAVRSMKEKGLGKFEGEYHTVTGKKKVFMKAILSALTDNNNQFEGGIGIFEDITIARQYKREHEITLSLLQILNRYDNLQALIKNTLTLLHNFSGCEAVGIRLQDGSDYPYFEVAGFPQSFFEKEKFLCETGKNGKTVCIENGSLPADCMCRCVIRGNVDTKIAGCTKYGSFWTNSTTELLALTPAEKRSSKICNRCNKAGYESVCLIPLKTGDNVLGLLQMNDFQRDCFDDEKIALFERLASSLAISIFQRMTSMTLKESETNLREAEKIAKIGSWKLDLLKNKFYWSDELYQMFSVEKHKPPTLDLFYEVILPEDREIIYSLKKNIENGRIPPETEFRILSPEKGVRFVLTRIKALTDKDGNIIQMVGSVQDITDHKLAEATIRENENLLRSIAENFPNSYISIIEKDFTVGFSSGQEFKKQNIEPEKFLGKSVEEIFGIHAKTVKEHYKKTFSGNACEFELFINNQYQLYKTVPLYSETKEIHRILVVVENITDRKKMEAHLQQAQRMESIGNLAGGIAHDFNNILFPIIGMSEMLLEDLPDDSPERENISEIFKAGIRGRDLVNQILSFSRDSDHKMSPLNIQPVLHDAIKLIRSTIPSSIEINASIDQSCGMVLADMTQIHQVVMNLMTNAFHAVENKQGIISVNLEEKDFLPGNLSGSDIQSGKYAVITVSDNGDGIDKKNMDKIFDPYFTTKKKGKGTGLGLAVVYGIVKKHQGDLRVFSEKEKGTTFQIFLPITEKKIEPEISEKKEEANSGNEKILVVDDEASIARLQKLILTRLGYQVDAYTSSLDALKNFNESPENYDLVITDMTMPNMTGDELVKRLHGIREDIPVIVCTGFSERINKEKAEEIGIKGLLMKPIIKREMADIVRNILDNKLT